MGGFISSSRCASQPRVEEHQIAIPARSETLRIGNRTLFIGPHPGQTAPWRHSRNRGQKVELHGSPQWKKTTAPPHNVHTAWPVIPCALSEARKTACRGQYLIDLEGDGLEHLAFAIVTILLFRHPVLGGTPAQRPHRRSQNQVGGHDARADPFDGDSEGNPPWPLQWATVRVTPRSACLGRCIGAVLNCWPSWAWMEAIVMILLPHALLHDLRKKRPLCSESWPEKVNLDGPAPVPFVGLPDVGAVPCDTGHC
jgi:hypothetical protein